MQFYRHRQLLFTATVNSNNAAFLDGQIVPLSDFAGKVSTCNADETLWHSAKSKSFQLSLDIAESTTAQVTEGAESTGQERVWASFDSAPVTIISKPSKKTAKTRNISSCILAGGPVSLFNRINSQTVRTKYMTIEHNQLCASNIAWSAFAVNVVRPQGNENPLGSSRT